MDSLTTLWPYGLAFVLGGSLVYLMLWTYNRTFLRGMQAGEHRMRQALGLPEAEEQAAPTLPQMGSAIKTGNSLITKQYELLFDQDLATFIASGQLSMRWIDILEQISGLVDQQFGTFPPGTNTVVVRALRFLPDGSGEYIFEPLHNANLTSEKEPNDGGRGSSL